MTKRCSLEPSISNISITGPTPRQYPSQTRATMTKGDGGHTASLQDSIDDTLINVQSILRDLFEEGFITAHANIAHLLERRVGIHKVALTDKVGANLLLTRRRNRPHRPERLNAIRPRRSRSIQVSLINPTPNQQSPRGSGGQIRLHGREGGGGKINFPPTRGN
jgi:hypothetical protein